MKILEMLGFAKRRSWQELVGERPHMIDPGAADAGFGKRKSYDVVDRVAMIDVRGVLVNDEDWWDGWGMSTYDRITGEVRGAADDPNVDGILLRVNSPGGECDAAFESASEIVAAGKKKPVWSVAETSAYSAGYLLASSGSRLYVPPYTGGVGSIGVYSVHMDMSGYLDQMGVKATFITAGEGKAEGHPYKPLSAEGKAKMQAEIDRLYGLFVDHVAAQRNITAGGIREMGAACRSGQAAISQGLADKIGNARTALADMREYLNSRVSVFVASAGTVAEVVAALTADAQEIPAQAEVPVVEQAAVDDDPLVAAREAAAAQDRITALLVSVAGLPAERVQDFAGLTPEQVGERLLAERAKESAEVIVSQLQPHTGADAGPTNVNESAIVKAAERLAEARKGK
jgi:signal peptide peptidase SppA